VYIANQLQPRHDDDEGIGQLVDQPLVRPQGTGCWLLGLATTDCLLQDSVSERY
jgi:hypothetical protein